LTVPTSSVWLDEANSIVGASKSLPGIVEFLHTIENGPPLFYFILHFWIKLFGNSDVACALMPLLFSVLTPLCLFFLARDLFGTKTAIWATFLSSVNVRSIEAATYIRFYSLLELLVAVSFLTFFKMVKQKGYFVLYVLISVLGIYEHYYFAFVILSQFVICLLFHKKRLPSMIGALCLVIASFSPWIPIALKQFDMGANTWLNVVPDAGHLAKLFYRALFQDSGIFLKNPGHILNLTTSAFALIFLVTWVARAILYRKTVSADKEFVAVSSVMIAYMLCVVLPLFISMVRPIYEPGRYDMVGMPLLILFFSWVFSKVKNKWIILFLLLFYSIKTTGYQIREYRIPFTDRFQGKLFSDKLSVKKLSMVIEADDVLVHAGLSKLATEYYLNQYGVTVRESFMFPLQLENHPCWCDMDKLLANTRSLENDARSVADAVGEVATSRIYVFRGWYHDAISNYLINEMDKRFSLEKIYEFSGSFYREVRVYTTNKATDR